MIRIPLLRNLQRHVRGAAALVKKAAIALLIVVEVVALNALPVYGFSLKSIGGAIGGIFGGVVGGAVDSMIPSADEMLSDAEDRYNLDQGALQNFGETFNVSDQKNLAPEVQIFFSPTNPEPGKRIVAQALPKFFTNDMESLYYTWYLKRARCVTEGVTLQEINDTVQEGGSCDYNGDGVYDIRDMKIEAARVLAGGGFDINYNDQVGGDDDDNDGYVAYPGGNQSRSTTATSQPYYYYIHDFNSGQSFEIVDSISQDEIFGCGDGYVPICVADRVLTCPGTEVNRSVDRNRPLDVTAEGGTATGGSSSSDGTTTEATGGTAEGGSASGQRDPSVVAMTSIGQGTNSFSVCRPIGVPQCTPAVEQDSFGGGFLDLAGAGEVTCKNGGIPVCVAEDALRVTVDEARDRRATLNELRWLFIARQKGLAGDPRLGNVKPEAAASIDMYADAPLGGDFVPAPRGKFVQFQCSDEDIKALESFWPPPRYVAAVNISDGTGPGEATLLTAEDINALDVEALDFSSEKYVLDRYYSCDAELDGVTQYGVESTGRDIDMRRITTCTPQRITDENIQRFHLFPRRTASYEEDNQVGSETSPGFPRDEEEFYRTDPFDSDTSDNGINDEATIVGLGQSQFSWIYAPGDEVGVIVEGRSMIPTKHPDSSNMIMFATVNNACDYSGMVNNSVPSAVGAYQIGVRGRNVTIPAIAFEGVSPEEAFDQCLNKSPNAFVSPARGGAAKKLDVEMSVSPENPVNDPLNDDMASGHINMGSLVTINATVTNAKYRSDKLRYTWRIYRSNSGTADFDPANWTLVAGGDQGVGIFDYPESEITPLEGNGLSKISFRLNLSNDKLFGSLPDSQTVTYLRARVMVEEAFDLGSASLHQYNVSRGRGEVIFRVSRASNKLSVYNVRSAGEVVNGGAHSTQAICTGAEDPAQLVTCPVVRNQLLKIVLDDTQQAGTAQYTNFRWRVNNRPVTNPYGISCAGTGTAVSSGACIVIPVTGVPGDTFTVSVVANNVGKVGGTYGDGSVTEVTRLFVVVNPYVSFCDKIDRTEPDTSVGACQGVFRKRIATYVGDADAGRAIYSDSVFLAPPRSSPQIVAAVHPSWIADNTVLNWYVESVFHDVTGASFTVDGTRRNAGESSNVLVKAVYQQPKEIRDILRTQWRMTDSDVAPLRFSGSAQIEYAEDPQQFAASGTTAFFAAIGANAPGAALFLFRLFLAVGIIVVAMALLFTRLPQRRPQI